MSSSKLTILCATQHFAANLIINESKAMFISIANVLMPTSLTVYKMLLLSTFSKKVIILIFI